MRNSSKLRRPLVMLSLAASAAAIAQVAPPRNAPPPAPLAPTAQGRATFGAPLEGLTPTELLRFNAGRDEFETIETPATGLGPIFNGASCVQCHANPAPGGGSNITVTRFGRLVNGVFDPMTAQGGSLLQRFAIDPRVRETVPAEANVVAQRLSTPLYGAGLIEAIPDAAIIANAARPKADGITGRVAIVTDVTTGQQRVGRFGWKAQVASLLHFAADAYVNEMGITNRFFPEENAPNGRRDLLARFDRLADPEDAADPVTGTGDIDFAADFMRFLAPPAALPATASSTNGARVFAQIGCAECHQPAMRTAPNASAALDSKTLALYSDLLLHDMGALGDGIAQGTASPREMRTAPLWGLRTRTLLLHDGRAGTPDAAIRAHDGEASNARERYGRLGPAEQRDLLNFLGTL